MQKKVRVLIVDDSALIRTLLDKILSADPDIEVIGRVPDPFAARDILVRERPDVLTLDVEMPRMDGVTFLRKMMEKIPTPTVMLSSLTERSARITLEAMEAGAIDVLTKPSNLVDGIPEMADEIRTVVKRAARAKPRPRRTAPIRPTSMSAPIENTTDKMIVIGASTGGVEALAQILPLFPRTGPGIVVVIHMPAGYTKTFAERLDRNCDMAVREAAEKDRVRSGVILVAPGGTQHTTVTRFGGQYRIALEPAGPDDHHTPSVDRLFFTAAKAAGKNAVAAILTGMGEDGARGMKAMRSAGARCIAQDERTSVVFGMPKAALALGGAEKPLPLEDIPGFVVECFQRSRA